MRLLAAASLVTTGCPGEALVPELGKTRNSNQSRPMAFLPFRATESLDLEGEAGFWISAFRSMADRTDGNPLAICPRDHISQGFSLQ